MSPFSKTTLDINKLYVSSPVASKIPDEGEDKKDKIEDTSVSKQGRSTKADPQQTILGICTDVFNDLHHFVLLWDTDLSVREESDNDPNQSDDGDPEASPTKSPTTPKNVKCKNSSGTLCSKYVQWYTIMSYPSLLTAQWHVSSSSASSSPSPLQGFLRYVKYNSSNLVRLRWAICSNVLCN